MTNIPYIRQFSDLSVDSSESNLVGGWDMRNNGLYIQDKTLAGNDGTISSGLAFEYGTLGRQICFSGLSGYIDIGNISANCNTIVFWINPKSTTESLIDLDGGTHTVSIASGTITATGFDTPIIYVNGAVGSTVYADVPSFVVITTQTGFSVSDLDIGRISSSYYDGYFIGSVRIYNVVKNDAWVASEYRRGKSAIWVGATGVDAIGGSVTDGNLSNSSLLVKSGTWTSNLEKVNGIDSDVFECDASGFAYLRAGHFSNDFNYNAHGIYRWTLSKIFAGITRIHIIASVNDIYSSTKQNGYYISINNTGRISLIRVTNGTALNLFNSAVGAVTAGQWHQYEVRRNNAKQFSLYLDGELLVADSGSNPVTNSDHLVSYYWGFDCVTGDKLVWADIVGRQNLTKRVLV